MLQLDTDRQANTSVSGITEAMPAIVVQVQPKPSWDEISGTNFTLWAKSKLVWVHSWVYSSCRIEIELKRDTYRRQTNAVCERSETIRFVRHMRVVIFVYSSLKLGSALDVDSPVTPNKWTIQLRHHHAQQTILKMKINYLDLVISTKYDPTKNSTGRFLATKSGQV